MSSTESWLCLAKHSPRRRVVQKQKSTGANLVGVQVNVTGVPMNVPDNLRYAKSHEWIRDDGDGIFTVGISDYAQAEMTELVYVELPDPGRRVKAADEIAVVESVKSASDIYSPVSGEITESNGSLTDDPSAVNSDPYDKGWLFRINIDDPAELDALLTPEAYREQIS